MRFKRIPLTVLRAELPKRKRQVQLSNYRIAATYYGKIVGFLVPVADVQVLVEQGWITGDRTLELSLTEFRDRLTSLWERLHIDLDCVYVMFHRRRAAAFVSPWLSEYLLIPELDTTDLLMMCDDLDLNIEAAEGSFPREATRTE